MFLGLFEMTKDDTKKIEKDIHLYFTSLVFYSFWNLIRRRPNNCKGEMDLDIETVIVYEILMVEVIPMSVV